VKAKSLSLRLVVYLIVGQLAAFAIGWIITISLGLAGVEIFKTSWDELAVPRASALVIESLRRGENGQIRIYPSSALQSEMRRAPSMKYAAFDIEQKKPLEGSSPELAAELPGVIGYSPSHTHFILIGDSTASPLGYTEPRWTPFGKFHIAVYRQKFRWDDVFHAMSTDLKWLIMYLFTAMFMSGAITWFAVRRGLSPLRAVAREAAGVNMQSLNQRLSSVGVPAEIYPLVEAMNDALQRLDAGVARQRRFTANAAHELRTPIAILNARLDAPEEASFRVDLKRDARRIRNIVEQLLAMARINNRPRETNERVDVVAAVRTIAQDSALLAVRSRRQIEFDAPAGPIHVAGSRAALEAVVASLIDNALRAEPESGTVSVRVGEDGTISVEDHGYGVEENERELIFEPFWRKNETTPGTGLGLAIAKELIDMLGGRIWIEDTPGGGATFKIALAAMAHTAK